MIFAVSTTTIAYFLLKLGTIKAISDLRSLLTFVKLVDVSLTHRTVAIERGITYKKGLEDS